MSTISLTAPTRARSYDECARILLLSDVGDNSCDSSRFNSLSRSIASVSGVLRFGEGDATRAMLPDVRFAIDCVRTVLL